MDALPDDLLAQIVNHLLDWRALRASSRSCRRIVDALAFSGLSDYANAMCLRVRSLRMQWRIISRNLPLDFEPNPLLCNTKACFDPRYARFSASWHGGAGCMAFTTRGDRCTKHVTAPPYLCPIHINAVPFLKETIFHRASLQAL